jgi:hypothetical protein
MPGLDPDGRPAGAKFWTPLIVTSTERAIQTSNQSHTASIIRVRPWQLASKSSLNSLRRWAKKSPMPTTSDSWLASCRDRFNARIGPSISRQTDGGSLVLPPSP